jgi:hypothetical protein
MLIVGFTVLAASAAPASAGTTHGYVAATDDNYDYTFSIDRPDGVAVVVDRKKGRLNFRRAGVTLVSARLCDSTSENDASGAEAIRDEASGGKSKPQRVRGGVYRVGSQYLVAMRGGACLRFARASRHAPPGLVRTLALRTHAQLGHPTKVHPSDPDGVALAKRVTAAEAQVARVTMSGDGGVCSGHGLGCPKVLLPGSVAVSGAIDFPSSYLHQRVKLPGVDAIWMEVQESSAWMRFGDQGCWAGPRPASEVDPDPFSRDDLTGFFLGRYQESVGHPQALPDGRTSLAWRGYWSRGTAIIDAAAHVVDVQMIDRWDPALTLSLHYTQSYPPNIDRVSTQPQC